MAGQIIKRGAKTWLVRIFTGRDANGKQKFHHKTIHGTKRDAERYLTATRREMDLGVFVEPAAMSVNEYFDRWLRDAARPRVSRRTAYGYTGILERYLRAPLGHKRLDKLQALDIQTIYGALTARGLSARLVRHVHSVLHNALKQAVKWGLLSRNPSDLVELPKVAHTERRVLSPEEAQRFLKAADVMPRGLIFEFALLTGMRPEEYLALKWSDIDMARRTAQVQRALVRLKKSWSFEEPKTARSRRMVYLSALLIEKLATHKRQQSEARLKLGAAWHAHDLIFCGVLGTPLSIPNITYRYFRPILTKAGLPRIRLYDLRHSCATLLLIAASMRRCLATTDENGIESE